MKIACAFFAKTIGLSHVKTRLAATLGKEFAETCYRLSVDATQEIAIHCQQTSKHIVHPFWALAEQSATTLPQWQSFPTLWTGEGDLGKRLHTIYSQLQHQHQAVLLMGTDSPHINPAIIHSAIDSLHDTSKTCVIGPCDDGGFYLFGATAPIPQSVWINITYSTDTTRNQLVKQLEQHGYTIEYLPSYSDIDTAEDIKKILLSLKSCSRLLRHQQLLMDWLDQQSI